MKNATEYLARVKALILVSPHVVPSETVREEAEGNMGLFRYRLRLQDDSLLAVFEPFEDELRCRFPIARSTSNPVTSNVQPATFNLQRANVPTFNLQPAAPLTKNLNAALTNADCAVVGTKHRPYHHLTPEQFLSTMRTPVIVDGRNTIAMPEDIHSTLVLRAVGGPTRAGGK